LNTIRKAYVLLLIGSLSAAFNAVLIRLCAFPPPIIASFRVLLAGLMLLPFCLGGLLRLIKEQGLRFFLRLILPGIALGLHFQFWVVGIKMTTVANGTFLFALCPIFFALAERFLYRRRINRTAYLSLMIALAGGLYLFFVGSGRFGALGDLWVFVSMLLYVLYMLLARKVSGEVPHLTFVHVIYLWGGLLTLPAALLIPMSGKIVWGDPVSLLTLMALVLFPTLVGHTAFNFAVRHISPLTVSFFTLFEPVTNTLTAALILGEIPRLVEVPGYLLLLGSTVVYLLSRSGRFSSERSGSGRA